MIVAPEWEAAMTRDPALRVFKLDEASYLVKSRSYAPGTHHVVTVRNGRIVNCSNCPAWRRWGRSKPCAHAGRVAKRILRDRRIKVGVR